MRMTTSARRPTSPSPRAPKSAARRRAATSTCSCASTCWRPTTWARRDRSATSKARELVKASTGRACIPVASIRACQLRRQLRSHGGSRLQFQHQPSTGSTSVPYFTWRLLRQWKWRHRLLPNVVVLHAVGPALLPVPAQPGGLW